MVILALLLLVGGAILNVAVAWNCAWWSHMLDAGSGPIETDAWVVAWLDRRAGEYTYPDGLPMPVHLWNIRGLGYRQICLSATVISGRVPLPPDRVIHLAGWPLLALEGDSTPEWTGVAYIYERRGMFSPKIAGQVRSTPFRPILPGFVINTLFYALLLWLLIFAPFAARRILRRRRGQCETCAYPIGVSPVCTECGAALPRKVEA